MTIFHNARIKLTFWYVVIIMIVSVTFSALVYRNVIGEVDRSFRIRSLRTSFITNQYLESDIKLYKEVKGRIITQLLLVNGLILLCGASAAYFLAGRTLEPIEEAMSAQKRFISDASHELRTPLTSMKTEIEVGLRDKGLNLRQTKALLASNLEEVNKMQQLSNYLLALTRSEELSPDFKKTNVNLQKVVEKVIAKLTPLAKKKKIQISTNLSDLSIHTSDTVIEELISILLDNAIKYTPNGGKVILSLKQSRNCAVLEVTDNGIGIKNADLPYIFNRFYRADTSRTKEKVDGYGLGLSIAKSIVESLGGELKVKSKPSVGSTFTAILPKS